MFLFWLLDFNRKFFSEENINLAINAINLEIHTNSDGNRGLAYKLSIIQQFSYRQFLQLIMRAFFVRRCFGSFFHVPVTRKKAAKTTFVRKIRM